MQGCGREYTRSDGCEYGRKTPFARNRDFMKQYSGIIEDNALLMASCRCKQAAFAVLGEEVVSVPMYTFADLILSSSKSPLA